MLSPEFVYLGVGVNFIVGVLYTIATLRAPTTIPGRGERAVRPNPVSWGIWSASGWIAAAGQLAEGAGVEVVLTICVAAIPSMIFVGAVATMWRHPGHRRLGRLDITCGILSVLTLFAWWVTASGEVAIGLAIAVDAIAAIPVIRQAYREPRSDTPSIWLAGVFSGTITLLSLDTFTVASSAFAIYFVALCSTVAVLLLVVAPLRARIGRARPERRPPDTATAAAFAGAFAADYLSWDEANPQRRGQALAAYLDAAPAVAATLGWSGCGRQRVELVLIGATSVDHDRMTVDIRVRFTPYARSGPVSPRSADPHDDDRRPLPGLPAAAPPPSAIGWAALSSRWTRITIVVQTQDGQLSIAMDRLGDAPAPHAEADLTGSSSPPGSSRPPAATADPDTPTPEVAVR